MIYTQSLINNKKKCGYFESSGISEAAERGVIIHAYLSDMEIEEVDGKYGATYRGKFTPYVYDHDFEELKAEADFIREKMPEYFGNGWEYEKTITTMFQHRSINCQVSGTMDRFRLVDESTVEIADWKTGMIEVDLNKPESLFQAILYSYLVFKTMPTVKVVTFTWIYTAKDCKTKEVKFTRKDRDLIKDTIFFELLLTSRVGYNLGKQCSYCAKSDTCPLIQEAMYNIKTDNLIENYRLYQILKKKLEVWMESIKADLIDEPAYHTPITNYYASLDPRMTHEQLMILVEKLKKVKLSKKDIKEFEEAGFNIETKASKRFKSPK